MARKPTYEELEQRLKELKKVVAKFERFEEAMRMKDSALESSINAIAFGEFGGNLTYVNRSFLELWGYDSDEEILGQPAVTFWKEQEKALEIIEALRNKGSWVGELVARRKDGTVFNAQVDMVMLDMIMPDMEGGKVYDRLKGINPDIKVLLSSGYSIDSQAQEILDRGCNGFIQKPFDIKQISRKIREILD